MYNTCFLRRQHAIQIQNDFAKEFLVYVKFKGTITKWPVQKLTYITTQKHVQHHDATDI